MKWTEIKVSDSPVSRSSHGISVVKNNVFMFGGEHDARTPLGKSYINFINSQLFREGLKNDEEMTGREVKFKC